MDTLSQAHLYVADQRGCSQTDSLRSYHTFNFGQYSDESRKPFSALHGLNDDALRAGASLTLSVEQAMHVVLIPVSGGLEYSSDLTTGPQTSDFLEPGQAGLLSLTAGMRYTVGNPYETETIQFIQLWLVPEPGVFSPGFCRTNFDLSCQNRLLPLINSVNTGVEGALGSSVFIGRYAGRQEDVFSVERRKNDQQVAAIFVFVLKGVFEVANRLLHERDGLSLLYRQDTTLAFEALSHDAILLLIELPSTLT